MSGAEEASLERLLEYLRNKRGFDFGGYKRPSLTRRIQRRMEVLGVGGYEGYLDDLEVHPGEFAELFDSILIEGELGFGKPDPRIYMRALKELNVTAVDAWMRTTPPPGLPTLPVASAMFTKAALVR